MIKFGYSAKMEENQDGVRVSWWQVVWKLDCPLNAKIFLWLARQQNSDMRKLLEKEHAGSREIHSV